MTDRLQERLSFLTSSDSKTKSGDHANNEAHQYNQRYETGHITLP